MLKVWGRRSSFNVQKVLWLVGELDLPHEHIPAGGDFGGLEDPGFRGLNPHGLVPVVQDGETTAWESHAILRYLAAAHGAGRFWPADPAARAPIDGWMDWLQTALQPAFLTGVFWGWYRTPEAQRDGPAVARALERTHCCLARVEERLEGRPFMAGEALSLADIPIGTSIAISSWRSRVRRCRAWRPGMRGCVTVRPIASMSWSRFRTSRGDWSSEPPRGGRTSRG
jgi:glutathione S-transferase